MKKYTKKAAKETVETYANMTSYFDESMTQREMFEMLRYRMQFGEAETRVIIAALVMAGANQTAGDGETQILLRADTARGAAGTSRVERGWCRSVGLGVTWYGTEATTHQLRHFYASVLYDAGIAGFSIF